MEEYLADVVYDILSNNTDKISGNSFMFLYEYGDIELDFNGKNYRLKIIEGVEENGKYKY